MPSTVSELLTPRILIVDDERQIHASMRLRLGRDYDLAFVFSGFEAIERIRREQFDLCFADIHMPKMDGFTFIEHAREHDAELGFVVVSAFETAENLKRAIPLQVLEFISKPLPDKAGFEKQVPGWIAETRRRRRERGLVAHAGVIEHERDAARIERDIELIASESARDALQQGAGLLTTIHAHLIVATGYLRERTRQDSTLNQLLRALEEARKTTEAAAAVSEGFFDSAYANRETAPALPQTGLLHAIDIAQRACGTDGSNRRIDLVGADDTHPVDSLSGIAFLLMMVPAISAALLRAVDNSTVRVEASHVTRMENLVRAPQLKDFCWINRRHAQVSQPAFTFTITATGERLRRDELEAWIKGDPSPLSRVPVRGLLAGLQRARGLLGAPIQPAIGPFRMVIALPHGT
jgi:CheY-like chemotaxis protein